MIKSRILRWAGRVARMEECGSAFKILTGIPRKETFTWEVHFEKTSIFFDVIYRKYASMSSDVSVRKINVLFFFKLVLFLTLHHKAYNVI